MYCHPVKARPCGAEFNCTSNSDIFTPVQSFENNSTWLFLTYLRENKGIGLSSSKLCCSPKSIIIRRGMNWFSLRRGYFGKSYSQIFVSTCYLHTDSVITSLLFVFSRAPYGIFRGKTVLFAFLKTTIEQTFLQIISELQADAFHTEGFLVGVANNGLSKKIATDPIDNRTCIDWSSDTLRPKRIRANDSLPLPQILSIENLSQLKVKCKLWLIFFQMKLKFFCSINLLLVENILYVTDQASKRIRSER